MRYKFLSLARIHFFQLFEEIEAAPGESVNVTTGRDERNEVSFYWIFVFIICLFAEKTRQQRSCRKCRNHSKKKGKFRSGRENVLFSAGEIR